MSQSLVFGKLLWWWRRMFKIMRIFLFDSIDELVINFWVFPGNLFLFVISNEVWLSIGHEYPHWWFFLVENRIGWIRFNLEIIMTRTFPWEIRQCGVEIFLRISFLIWLDFVVDRNLAAFFIRILLVNRLLRRISRIYDAKEVGRRVKMWLDSASSLVADWAIEVSWSAIDSETVIVIFLLFL